jgi:hypothetical protein
MSIIILDAECQTFYLTVRSRWQICDKLQRATNFNARALRTPVNLDGSSLLLSRPRMQLQLWLSPGLVAGRV